MPQTPENSDDEFDLSAAMDATSSPVHQMAGSKCCCTQSDDVDGVPLMLSSISSLGTFNQNNVDVVCRYATKKQLKKEFYPHIETYMEVI
jgi:hypothetical protein